MVTIPVAKQKERHLEEEEEGGGRYSPTERPLIEEEIAISDRDDDEPAPPGEDAPAPPSVFEGPRRRAHSQVSH